MKSVASLLRRSIDRKAFKSGGNGGFVCDDFELFVCDNGLDNVPERKYGADNGDGEKTAYFISQSRSPGHKDIGQDAMASANYGPFEVNVLCDGHDRDGHLVARAVCNSLPGIILRLISETTGSESAAVSESVLRKAFNECANEVCWTSEGVRTGMFVKIFGSDQWNGKVGYVGEQKDDKSAIVIVVDENGYHRPVIDRAFLKRAKYTGGCTCIAVVRNRLTTECRIAVTGDSRALVLFGNPFEDPILRPVFGLMGSEKKKGRAKAPPMGMTSPAHNVFSKHELLRLNTNHAGAFEIDGAFLVNPVTKFAIQPTRGFGDFDMFGTGYTNEPEVSSTFKLPKGNVMMVASDGIFDDHVWHDDELVSFFNQHYKPDVTVQEVAQMLYDETLSRSLSGGYVDDISFFLYKSGGPAPVDHQHEEGGESVMSAPPPDTASTTSSNMEEESKGDRRNSNKSAPESTRKSLLGFWKKKKGSRKSDRLSPKKEELITTRPQVDKASPEDRRRTIDRKDRGSFTELSNLLKQALAADDDDDEEEEEEEQEKNSEDEKEARTGDAEENQDLARLVLKRFASRYGHDLEDIDVGRVVAEKAARTGKRLSKRLSKRHDQPK